MCPSAHSWRRKWPLYRSTSVKKLEDFVGAKFSCPHALTHGNQRMQIREKMLEFSSSVLSTLSPYLIIKKIQLLKVYRTLAIYS